MSIKYMDRVWEIQELKGGRLLLMLAIADHANDAGECWPSQQHLAKKARLEVRQARRVIDSLVKDGYLLVFERLVERKKRPIYKLFPGEADKMSGQKRADILSGKKRTFLPEGTGHFAQVRPDISDTIPSHAGSESPIKPSGNRIISSDPLAVIWSQCLEELSPTLPSVAAARLAGSQLEGIDESHYRVVLGPHVTNGLDWLNRQAKGVIQRTLSVTFRRHVLIEIVAAEPAQEDRP